MNPKDLLSNAAEETHLDDYTDDNGVEMLGGLLTAALVVVAALALIFL